MLRKIRITLASVFFIGLTLLFLDFTGTLHHWLGWLAKVQALEAVLALNVGIIIALVLLTLVFGRIYCSVICPLGILQDIFGWLGKKAKKNRYTYSNAISWLRYGVLVIFVVALIAGLGSVFQLLAPYSAFGRITTMLLQPVYMVCNNMASDVSSIISEIRKDGKRFAGVNANFYAARCSDIIFESPNSSNKNDIFSADVPFYQIVFRGYIPITSEIVIELF